MELEPKDKTKKFNTKEECCLDPDSLSLAFSINERDEYCKQNPLNKVEVEEADLPRRTFEQTEVDVVKVFTSN